jgi:hypothetical protein
MSVPARSRVLELRVEMLRARSQARQRRLQDILSQPPTGPRRAARRLWRVKRALRMVERRRAAVETREALLKVYEDHLAGVQKILNEAAEKASRAASASETPDGELKAPDAGPKRPLKL